MGKCGLAHQAPKDQKEQFCLDVAATAGLRVPYDARNFKFWQRTPSGHAPSEAKRKRAGSPAPSAEDEEEK
jgi:hypothetical protein